MITILTPAYNRRHTLKRLFDSLCEQTNKSFEWLLIDDGSTDGTDFLVRECLSNGNFVTRYLYQANSGKHVAINNGVLAAQGDWIFIVDSDDQLTPDAIQGVLDSIEGLDGHGVVGVCFRRAHLDGRLVGVEAHFDVDSMLMHPSNAANVLHGDLAYLFTREVMLNTPFPVVKGEKFVPELYIWNQIGDQGDICYFVNRAIYLCEYLPDGYTQNFSANLRKNCRGFQMFYKEQYFRERTLKGKLKCIVRTIQCEWFVFLRAIS